MIKNDQPATPYDKRLQLVAKTLQLHGKLADKAAVALAAHVLRALDHIPELVR